jgi:hypothetical protein
LAPPDHGGVSKDFSPILATIPTPIITTSRLSSALNLYSGLDESLGRGSARDGRILRSLAAFDVSWKTGMLQKYVKELA